MMDRMVPDPPPTGASPTPQEAVVEFGPDPDAAPGPRRRWNLSGLLPSLAADRRAVPLAAAVGAVALFASLVSEWQVTSMDTAPFGGPGARIRPVAAGVADLGALGAGYLTGLFVLAAAVVLMLFGPPAAGAYARLVGLGTAGVLLAIVAALASDLGDVSRAIDRIFMLQLDEDRLVLTYGRGIWCAGFGVAALLLALYLAGRHTTPVASEAEGDSGAAPEPLVVWSWRRPRTGPDEAAPEEPFDLTVSSTTPFTSLTNDRDRPTGSDRSG